ncbi:unnamed protein product [Caretta caretta]
MEPPYAGHKPQQLHPQLSPVRGGRRLLSSPLLTTGPSRGGGAGVPSPASFPGDFCRSRGSGRSAERRRRRRLQCGVRSPAVLGAGRWEAELLGPGAFT